MKSSANNSQSSGAKSKFSKAINELANLDESRGPSQMN